MGSPGLVDSPTDLHHQRLVLLYAVLDLRDGFGLYTEHQLEVASGYLEEWVSDASKSPQEDRTAALSLREFLWNKECHCPSLILLWIPASSGGSWSAREHDWLAHLLFLHVASFR